MIIATLSDFKLFWDLLDNTDTTPDNHRAGLGLYVPTQIEAQHDFFQSFWPRFESKKFCIANGFPGMCELKKRYFTFKGFKY